MKSFDPNDQFDRDYLGELGLTTTSWQLQLLAFNPSYVFWAPGDDYMVGDGWEKNWRFQTWSEFRSAGWNLDDLNECVHFYFEIQRDRSVRVVFWMIHPRKGGSRGITVGITQDDVPAVLSYLAEAARRNAARFAAVCAAAGAAS